MSLQKVGFPRVKALKKKYKWRKMNFLTNLPKNKPLVLLSMTFLFVYCMYTNINYFHFINTIIIIVIL